MSTGTVSEAIARPARTAVQGGAAWVLVEFYVQFFRNLTDGQFAAAVALLTLLLSAGQALVENRTGKGLLRQVPPVEVPVADSAGPTD